MNNLTNETIKVLMAAFEFTSTDQTRHHLNHIEIRQVLNDQYSVLASDGHVAVCIDFKSQDLGFASDEKRYLHRDQFEVLKFMQKHKIGIDFSTDTFKFPDIKQFMQDSKGHCFDVNRADQEMYCVLKVGLNLNYVLKVQKALSLINCTKKSCHSRIVVGSNLEPVHFYGSSLIDSVVEFHAVIMPVRI